ncbi:MAG: glycosyltransferase [Lachnospiraceae bacterium]|nr:glycosyltransferase [Lachnospiraceae bacterium]
MSAIVDKIKKNKLARIAKNYVFYVPYSKYYEKLSVDKNVILYESFYGAGMTCGPKALFNELIKNDKYKHVWVYNNESDWKDNFEEYKGQENVSFVKIKSKAYYKYLASAGYLINNSTFPPCYTRKEGQTYINTWHGIPLKLMGYEMPKGNIQVANTERNFLQASYLLSANEHLTDMYMKSYKLEGILPGKIIEAGQARTDTIVNGNRENVLNKLIASGVEIDKNKKIVMYAPTWKGVDFNNTLGDVEKFEEIYDKLKATMDSNQMQLLIKPHQAIYKKVKGSQKLKDVLVSPLFDTNEVLCGVDVLISDYSSIFFDYLVTDKPILFYIPDLNEYKETRGMYMDISELPGPATDSIEELKSWLSDLEGALKSKVSDYSKAKERFCKYDDGHVAARVVDAIFNGNEQKVKVIRRVDEKKKIFISLGRALQNGITHSFLSLLNNIDYDKYDVTAYLYEAITPDQEVRMEEINKNVRVLVRTGYNFASIIENAKMVIAMAFNIEGPFKKLLPQKMFERQAKRLAGDAKFDAVVEFCGYSPIMAFEFPYLNAPKKSIWMHNDLIADQMRKVNHKRPLKRKLQMIFNMYPEWDRLVSCSHSVMEVNKKNLAKPETIDKFSFAKNTINYKRVYDCLDEEAVYEGFELPKKEETNFVTMGRYSPEKNHKELVNAFAEYLKDYEDSKLYIIGQGPLQGEVEALVKEKGIEDKVIMTGNQANPFKLMSMCDCFILPSIYEGQPMVLLEARIVGLPIIVSDFSSVTDSLMENGQYLIKADKNSIIDGLRAFREGRVPQCEFDPVEYNKEAVREFENAIF